MEEEFKKNAVRVREKVKASSTIPLAQAKQMLCERLQNVMLNDRRQLWKMWHSYDTQHRGFLTPKEFRQLLLDCGLELSDEHADDLMSRFANGKKDGMISFKELFGSVTPWVLILPLKTHSGRW